MLIFAAGIVFGIIFSIIVAVCVLDGNEDKK